MSVQDWEAEDSQSFLVSVSDLMSSMIFIFIITLMMFALRFNSATTSLESATSTRTKILRMLRDSLAPSLEVEIVERQGILRLTAQSINFPSGSADPIPDHEPRIRALATVLGQVLPCFLPGRAQCDGMLLRTIDTVRYAAVLEAVLIEGHTDTVPIAGALRSRYPSNMELSGARAARVLQLMSSNVRSLDSLRNRDGLQLLSISGYGERRLADSTNRAGASNRRIDLRFLMEPPDSASGIVPTTVTRALRARQ